MIRLILAIAIGRLAGRLSRLLGRGGSAIPGLVAAKICPTVIDRLVANLPGGVVVVTGTNGKTTTTKLLVTALEAAGTRVITNPTGSNLERGVATVLIERATMRGRPRGDLAVFEVDEAALRTLAPRVRLRLVVVTNLARDQLDRYGELDTTAGHISSALVYAGSSLLNADDPKVAALADGSSSFFGAVAEIRHLMPPDDALYSNAAIRDPSISPVVEVTTVEPLGDGGQVVGLATRTGSVTVRLAVPGVYNAYNAAAALGAAMALGVGAEAAAAAFEQMTPPFGRGQVIEYQGRRVVVLLVKNPSGLNQAVRLLGAVDGPSQVLIAINDEHADGRDVSWLWDARVEELAGTGHRFGASGTRAADMALRLKYAGIDAWHDADLERAVERAVAGAEAGDTVYVVPTYTAMLRLLGTLLPGVPRHEVWA
ncbi:MAG: MurT ligase domain-containing protein [Acidimicrobiia bacterium]